MTSRITILFRRKCSRSVNFDGDILEAFLSDRYRALDGRLVFLSSAWAELSPSNGWWLL